MWPIRFLERERNLTNKGLEAIVSRMTGKIAHRGPDSWGTWVDENEGLALGHRRLAILDLAPAGHQPMLSTCGRYVIVYNGEIYNYREIRHALEEEVEPCPWRGHSDTEVILAPLCSVRISGLT